LWLFYTALMTSCKWNHVPRAKVLNQAVKRNLDRFPQDFMFEPNSSELADLRSQIVTLDQLTRKNYIFKYTPRLFTENGVAMLSSVLKSKEAIQINISIMRIFTKLKNIWVMEDRLDNIDQQLEKTAPIRRKKIVPNQPRRFNYFQVQQKILNLHLLKILLPILPIMVSHTP
jgi:hypothetical protein